MLTVRAITNATATESQTTLKGTSCLFTRYHTCENGIAPSLEKAYPILELLVTQAVPQRKTAMAMMTHGLPFPVLALAAFGVRGAHVPAVLRALVSCGWFGIESWIGESVLAAIADGRCTPGVRAPTVYPIGPVISFTQPAEQPHECVQWLDTQPPASVVLLCFGSVGFFTAPQAHEIAHGLERSGHRFLWVLRGPPAPGGRHPSDANLDELLPDGFLERTKGRGLVWPTKAPQKEILAHAAVGGFVTHGGWNSVLESLWFGVPMAPWPLYAEQHMNAFTLVAYMGVAVAMKVDRKRNNFVEAAELERAVKELMGAGEEGRKAREKAMEMRAACRNALEEGGSSYASLRRLSEEMCMVNTNQ